MNYIMIPDTYIIAINYVTNENESSKIIYRCKNGSLHTIDLETCARNYKTEHLDASANCVGERNIDESCFVLYTSGVKTKIVFQKRYVVNFLHAHFLSGGRNTRFLGLQSHIKQAKYTTFDLS